MGTMAATADVVSGSPVLWVRHESTITADPCVRQLIDQEGFEGYGVIGGSLSCFPTAPTHEIPPIGARGYKRFLLGLGFADDESFDGLFERAHFTRPLGANQTRMLPRSASR